MEEGALLFGDAEIMATVMGYSRDLLARWLVQMVHCRKFEVFRLNSNTKQDTLAG